MASTPDGHGYWLVASDDATFQGSAGSLKLNKPVVGMMSSTNDNGYSLVASDGGIFNYGDAVLRGSTGGLALAAPIVAMRCVRPKRCSAP